MYIIHCILNLKNLESKKAKSYWPVRDEHEKSIESTYTKWMDFWCLKILNLKVLKCSHAIRKRKKTKTNN